MPPPTSSRRGESPLSPVVEADEARFDATLRPHTLEEYVGQTRITGNLRVFIAAARKRREAMDHVLLAGPPGLGKTTLALVIAHELGVPVRTTQGPVLERHGDLAAILTSLEPKSVLFIDEIHRMPAVVEEILYPAMEDFRLDLVVGKGPGARTIRLDLPRFTLVGATTRTGLLSTPLRERFGFCAAFEFYPPRDLERILSRSAALLKIHLTGEGAEEIANRSRGTPRIANRLLRRVRDFTEVEGRSSVDRAAAASSLERLEVDSAGLDRTDRAILNALLDRFHGGPVGVETLAAVLQEEPDTLEEVHEPYLLQAGFLERTPRGRVAGDRAYAHLHRPRAKSAENRLL